MEKVFIRLVDDLGAPGVTVLDEDGNYNVYVNARLSYEQQKKVADHEMNHIRMGHFYDDRPVADNEREAG